MSGIYIPGIDMPKSCNECRFFVDAWCYALEVDDWRNAYNKPQEGKRLDGCPLIPVPDHGRLIDADALLRHKGVRDYKYDYETGNVYVEIDDICGAIDNAPTVIPAEEGQ